MSDSFNQRRTEPPLPQIGDYFNSPSRYYNQLDEKIIVNVHSGEYHVADSPEELMVTILGSCVAACVFDPFSKVAGMNHFLVPGNIMLDPSPRYGIFLMEYMINEVLKRGGIRSRLIVKIFGGASLMEGSSLEIGQQNIKFAQEYFANEGMEIAASDVGGNYARRIHFNANNGKVMLRKLSRNEDFDRVIKEEKNYSENISTTKNPGNIDLFK